MPRHCMLGQTVTRIVHTAHFKTSAADDTSAADGAETD